MSVNAYGMCIVCMMLVFRVSPQEAKDSHLQVEDITSQKNSKFHILWVSQEGSCIECKFSLLVTTLYTLYACKLYEYIHPWLISHFCPRICHLSVHTYDNQCMIRESNWPIWNLTSCTVECLTSACYCSDSDCEILFYYIPKQAWPLWSMWAYIAC